MSRRTRHFLCVLAVFALSALTPGCGAGRSTVTGRVTYDDGTPVEEGTVIAEAEVDGKLVGVQGIIEKDGSFSMGGEKLGDGALPGNYRVLVMPRALGEGEKAAGKVPAVDGKFGKYETSGIAFEVKPGKNQWPITVTRPTPKTKGK
jgi:hypothetical protein